MGFLVRNAVAAIAGLSMLGLAGCETAPTYGPQTSANSTGYADKQLAQNRYRVSYQGNAFTKRETVEDFLLRHAAEVTLKADYPSFLFDTRDTKADTQYYTDFAGWPGRGWYWHSWADDSPAELMPTTRYDAYAEIVLLTADQAKSEPRALGAQDVLSHLAAQP